MTTATVVYVPAACMADRIGRKPLVIATFRAFSLFPVAVVLATSFPGLVVAFVVGGLHEIGEPARKALIVDLAEPHMRARSVGLYYLGRSLAITPAAFLGGLLWRVAPALPFLAAAGVGLVGTAVFAPSRARGGRGVSVSGHPAARGTRGVTGCLTLNRSGVMARWTSRPPALVVAAGLALYAAACRGGAAEDAHAAEPRSSARAAAQDIDWKRVDQAMGRTGQAQDGGVHRYNMPRSDLHVTVDGVQIAPALALGSWLAFRASGANEAVAMGDLVLTEQEYNRVIARLQQGGVGQTAVHKHLPETSPAIWWTHVHGHGDPVQIARTVREALALTGTPPASLPGGPAPAIDLDTAAIHEVLGHDGTVSGGVYHVNIPRPETIRAGGVEVPPAMGTATALNFQPTGGGRAAINGDFVMTAGEVNAVIAALREHDIRVVALHNHMLDEEPRLFFMHFWANDDAVKLARGLRAAVDRTGMAGR